MQTATRRGSQRQGDGLSRDEHGRIRRESIPTDRRGNPAANRAWVLYQQEQGHLPFNQRNANKARPLPPPKAPPPAPPVEVTSSAPSAPRTLSVEEQRVRDLRKRMEKVVKTPDLLRQLQGNEPTEMRDLIKETPSGVSIQRWTDHANRLLDYVSGS